MITDTPRSQASASGVWLAARTSASRLRLAFTRSATLGPVAIVALALTVLVAQRLSAVHGNPSGLILFGSHFVQFTHPLAGAPALSRFGYDGQFYWIQANDPLLLHRSTLIDLHATAPGYDLSRVAYPALAFLLALGQRAALPWTMLAVNVLAVLGLTAAFARYARGRGWSPAWALVVGLTPGLLMPALRDLTDPLAIAAMLGGLLAWDVGRRWSAAVLLGVAVLSREPTAVAVAAVALDAAAGWWRTRAEPGALGRAARRAWPVVVIPTGAFIGWHLYTRGLYVPGAASGSGANLAVLTPSAHPFSDFVAEIRRTLGGDSPASAAWDLVYMAIVLCGIGCSVWLLRRGLRAATLAAALSAAVIPTVPFGDQWGLSRYAAPMFVMLALAGLQQRSRAAVAICIAAASMSAFVPLVIPGA